MPPTDRTPVDPTNLYLDVQLGRLQLANPITVASGTFGYAREMAGLVDLSRLGGILPKTITQQPRAGNPPPRTVETTGGMLNSIGLDNDGIEAFLERQLPYLASLKTAVIVSIAGKTADEFVAMAGRLEGTPGIDALELNMSCPNVSGGVDFGTNPALCEKVVSGVRRACSLPILAKLTPNVTDITEIARAAEAARGRRPVADQHVPGDGRQLAAAPARAGQRAGRAERPGHQAHRLADRLPGCQGGQDSADGRRRHRHRGRRDGVPRGRRHGRADRHGQLLQSQGFASRFSTPCPPPWPNLGPAPSGRWWERWKDEA